MQTIGRNDPCFCGSGRKFKHCCERSGSPAQETPEPEWISSMREAIGDRNYEDMEELQAATDRFFLQRNEAPKSDFHGLSSDQMELMLHFPFEAPELVEFSERLKIHPESPFMHLFGALADAIGREDGLKATAKGNLPRHVCKDAAVRFWNKNTFPYQTLFGKVNKEMDFFDLHVVRVVAEMAGLIRKYKGRFILSRDCRARLEEGGMAAVYPVILKTCSRTFNWAYRDGYPDLGFIQQSFLFTLFLLTKHGGEWLPHVFYEDQFLRAFPTVLNEVPEEWYSTPEDAVRSCYTHRALLTFAGCLGLAEVEQISNKAFVREYRIRSTPLLLEALRFHV